MAWITWHMANRFGLLHQELPSQLDQLLRKRCDPRIP